MLILFEACSRNRSFVSLFLVIKKQFLILKWSMEVRGFSHTYNIAFESGQGEHTYNIVAVLRTL